MRYPVNIERDGSGFMASFPDIPEALTQGETRDEALKMARDALVTAFEFYFEDNRPIPISSNSGLDYVDVPASVAAKIVLLNTILETGATQAELARKMGTRPQEMQRIVNLRHVTKLDTIESALNALGKQLEITVK